MSGDRPAGRPVRRRRGARLARRLVPGTLAQRSRVLAVRARLLALLGRRLASTRLVTWRTGGIAGRLALAASTHCQPSRLQSARPPRHATGGPVATTPALLRIPPRRAPHLRQSGNPADLADDRDYCPT